MSWFDTILSPIMWVVAWIMVYAHKLFVFIGMDPSGWSWVLSIVVLVILIRILLIPLFVKQIKASRGLQIVQPEIQKLQKKYKGKTDPASRQAMQQEMMAIYREAGTNPFASCLPILAQSPIFFALFRVLYQLPQIASGARGSIGPLNAELAAEAENSTFLGAPLSSWFLQDGASGNVRLVAVILIIAMSVTTFTTQRQLTMKNMPAAALDNPMARQQKMMMYLLPLVFAVSGVNFPIGVLIYWTTTNLWSMGQQFYTIRNMPAPGSEAEKKYKQRLERRAARKGIAIPTLESGGGAALLEDARPAGQRQQPVGKKRAKQQGLPKPAAAAPESGDAPEGSDGSAGPSTGSPAPRGGTNSTVESVTGNDVLEDRPGKSSPKPPAGPRSVPQKKPKKKR